MCFKNVGFIYYYSDMVRPTDQERIVIEKDSLLLTEEGQAVPWGREHRREHQGWSGGRGNGGSVGQSLYCNIYRQRQAEAGKQG